MLYPRSDKLNYAEAESVGLALKQSWPAITGQPIAPDITDEQWADMTQFVMRRATTVINERPERDSEAQ